MQPVKSQIEPSRKYYHHGLSQRDIGQNNLRVAFDFNLKHSLTDRSMAGMTRGARHDSDTTTHCPSGRNDGGRSGSTL
ncbi:hypothetical protein [secondary endosymbiont of Ctenarytaina eucalypti]|uniref:hypothetical protein n=1 Tax=secondary endosymbiont of Ctenarytaina eucalypti TaxID=1199245 RepID=UPI00135A61DB|nr:hypothetical protein [secondary endosymbiont of Ctenarytaina eucalypti]